MNAKVEQHKPFVPFGLSNPASPGTQKVIKETWYFHHPDGKKEGPFFSKDSAAVNAYVAQMNWIKCNSNSCED